MPTLAKLSRPKTHRALARERLFTRLDEARQRPLVWITSPPGAGKTTLVSTYVEQRRLRALWYHVDAGDEDIGTFFHYLARAVPAKRRDAELPAFLPAHRADLAAFCRHFFRALYSRPTPPALLVLDNYHALSASSPLHGLLDAIVAEVPDEHSMVVISRAAPPPEAANLSLTGRLVGLDWSQLRMTLDETRAVAHAQASVDERTLQVIHRLADGWAAGVALGLQRLSDAGRVSGEAGAATSAAVFDYFATQFLRQAAPELRRFLLDTALLPTLTAETAASISERADSAVVLEDLHRSGLFTNRRNTKPPIYQYHDLFREFLLVQLEAERAPAELRALQRRAGRLLEADGQHDHAIRLYLDVQDWADARRVLMQAAPLLLAQGRSESLRDWIRALPTGYATDAWMDYWLGAALARLDPHQARVPLERAWRALAGAGADALPLRRLICADMVLTYAFEYADFTPLDEWGAALLSLIDQDLAFDRVPAELHVHAAALFALVQRLPRARAVERSRRRIESLVDDPAVPADLAAMALGFVLVLHFSVGDLHAGADVVRRLEATLRRPDLQPFATAVNWIQVGHFQLRAGDLSAAVDALQRGYDVARAHALDPPMLRVFSNLGLAFCALQRGDLEQADVHRRLMEQSTTADRVTDRVAVLRVRAWIACQRRQWPLAHELAVQQLDLIRRCGLFVVHVECCLLAACTSAHVGDDARFQAALDEAAGLIADTAFEHFGYHLDLLRAYRARLNGERDACRVWLERGLASSRSEQGHFMLRMQPWVASSVLAEALTAGVEVGYATQLIQSLQLPPPDEPVENWPWPIRVYTLGRFEVQRDGQALAFSRKAPKKTLALLKAIIAHGGEAVREQRVLDAFWADEEGDVAVRSLTAALHRLRGLLGDPDAIIQQGGTLSLNRARVWVDALALDAALSKPTPPTAQDLLALYRGSFLAEDDGEPWSVTTRERLRSRFIHALGTVTAALERDGSFELAIECYLRGIDADPVTETFYQGLMRCYAASGRRAEAVAAYRRLRHILSVTLSLKPSTATERLYQTLRLD